MEICYGLRIFADKNKKSEAVANQEWFIWPKETGKLKIDSSNLYFAGGNDKKFGIVDIEIWGFN